MGETNTLQHEKITTCPWGILHGCGLLLLLAFNFLNRPLKIKAPFPLNCPLSALSYLLQKKKKINKTLESYMQSRMPVTHEYLSHMWFCGYFLYILYIY